MPDGSAGRAQYNTVFEKLVTNAGDDAEELVGRIAYAYYKEAKRSIIRTTKNKEEADTASAFFVRQYMDENTLLDKHKAEAERILLDYAVSFSRNTLYEQRQKELLSEFKTIAKATPQKNRWAELFTGAAASILAAVILFLISLGLSMANPETNYGKVIQAVVFGKGDIQIVHHKPIEKDE